MDLTERIKQLEDVELRDQDSTTDDVYKLLLVNYLLNDEPMKAKLLWKRIPLNVKQDTRSELSALWQFSKLFIQRKYAQLFELANQLKSNSNHEWSTSELKSQFERLVEKTQSDLFDLISLAYSSISVRDLSHLFAMSNNPERVVELTNAKGWTLDESRNFLIPKKKQSMEIVDIPNQLQMQQLTNLVSFLET